MFYRRHTMTVNYGSLWLLMGSGRPPRSLGWKDATTGAPPLADACAGLPAPVVVDGITRGDRATSRNQQTAAAPIFGFCQLTAPRRAQHAAQLKLPGMGPF